LVDTPVIQHWIVAVSRAAHLDQADTLNVSSDATITSAWDAVATHTGTSVESLAERVAAHYRLAIARLDEADPNARKLLPAEVARALNVLPLKFSDRSLVIATADPVGMDAEREISQISGRAVHFEIAPPRALADAVADTYPETTPTREIPRPTPAAKGAKVGQHVLVVDDDADTRHLLRTVLEAKGFRVTEASDGPEALALMMATDESFDLVTLDLYMEKMSGLEILRHMRSRMRTAIVPVVVATASDDPSVEMQLFEAGADDFVIKPVDPPRFVLRIQAVLRRRQGGLVSLV
jgi:CheY-like chemotaxis protein